jgi:hypothetical protein
MVVAVSKGSDAPTCSWTALGKGTRKIVHVAVSVIRSVRARYYFVYLSSTSLDKYLVVYRVLRRCLYLILAYYKYRKM